MRTSHVVLISCLVAVCLVSLSTAQTKRAKKRRNRCGSAMAGIEQNITALWQKVNLLSVPVHVHVHGVGTQNDDVTVMEDNMINKEKRHIDEEVSEKHEHEHRAESNEGEYEEEEDGSSSSSEEEEDTEKFNRGPNIHIHLNMGERKAVSREETHTRDIPRQHVNWQHEYPPDEYEHEPGEKTHIRDIPRQHVNLQHTNEMNHGFAEHEYPDEYIYARCDMVPNVKFPNSEYHEVQGSIYFRQKPSQDLEINIDLYGFYAHPKRDSETRHLHGFHLHEFADFSNGCNSFGGHFNPHGTHHGGPENEHKHIGDWGNIESDYKGIAKHLIKVKHSTLYGPHSIAGRGVVVHAEGDDLGRADTDASRSSGNAGGRIACCVVGYSNGKVNNWPMNKN